jgi:hypothetical protein
LTSSFACADFDGTDGSTFMNTALVVVALVALGLAAAMTCVAWRANREQRRRSEARIAALAAEIGSHADDVRPQLEAGPLDALSIALRPAHRLAAIALAALLLGLATTLVVGALRGSRPTSDGARHGGRVEGAVRQLPLELLALTHQRGDNGLTVTGVVRNPSEAVAVPDLAAVVQLFRDDGAHIATVRAAVDSGRLAPGVETPFAVTVPAAPGVALFRVSFRVGDRVLPHVDRRPAPGESI